MRSLKAFRKTSAGAAAAGVLIAGAVIYVFRIALPEGVPEVWASLADVRSDSEMTAFDFRLTTDAHDPIHVVGMKAPCSCIEAKNLPVQLSSRSANSITLYVHGPLPTPAWRVPLMFDKSVQPIELTLASKP